MSDAKAEIIRLIGMISGGASALQMICKINKNEVAEHIAADIEENAWKLLKYAVPEEYKKVQEYWEKEQNDDADTENPSIPE